jgi:hypothetical protein
MTDSPKTTSPFRPIDGDTPINTPILVCWLDDGSYDAIEMISMQESREAFWNLNSGNLNRKNPTQPHQWPSHWMPVPPAPIGAPHDADPKTTEPAWQRVKVGDRITFKRGGAIERGEVTKALLPGYWEVKTATGRYDLMDEDIVQLLER